MVSVIMKETMTQAAIFDIDGTLVDSREGHLKSWMAALANFGIEADPDVLMTHFGQTAPLITAAFAPQGSTDEFINEIVEFKRDYFSRNVFDQLRLFPGVFELFDFLVESEGYKLALLTSASRKELEAYKTRLLYDKYFVDAICGEDVARSKPDPEGIIKLQPSLGVPFDKIIMIGDSPHDIRAALKAGTKAIAVTSGGYSFKSLLDAGANKIFTDIAQIVDKLPISLWLQ